MYIKNKIREREREREIEREGERELRYLRGLNKQTPATKCVTCINAKKIQMNVFIVVI